MSYSLSLSSVGSLGDDAAVRRLAAGQDVTVKLEPRGTTSANYTTVFAAIERAVLRTGLLKSPRVVWGAGDNQGRVVIKGSTRTGENTRQQLANKLAPAIRSANTELGAERVRFISVVTGAPRGELAPAAPPTPAAPPVPTEPELPAPPSSEPSGGGGPSSSEPAPEDAGFFGKKVGGVPVWALGAGALTLGVGLVLVVTMRKKPAPVAKNPRDRMSLRDRSRMRRRGQELRQVPWGTLEEVETVELIRKPGIATRVETLWREGDEKQVLYRLSPPYEYNSRGDTTEYVVSSARIVDGRKETLVFISDASGTILSYRDLSGDLHTLDTDKPVRGLGYTVVP